MDSVKCLSNTVKNILAEKDRNRWDLFLANRHEEDVPTVLIFTDSLSAKGLYPGKFEGVRALSNLLKDKGYDVTLKPDISTEEVSIGYLQFARKLLNDELRYLENKHYVFSTSLY